MIFRQFILLFLSLNSSDFKIKEKSWSFRRKPTCSIVQQVTLASFFLEKTKSFNDIDLMLVFKTSKSKSTFFNRLCHKVDDIRWVQVCKTKPKIIISVIRIPSSTFYIILISCSHFKISQHVLTNDFNHIPFTFMTFVGRQTQSIWMTNNFVDFLLTC